MLRRMLGSTGLEVPVLGLGAGPLGDARLDEGQVARLLHAAVDHGVTLLDTAPSYGESEVRIGRHLGAARRARVVLSTKVGYGVEGVPDWTYDCVRRGVEAALVRLRTDVLDVVHLHSCPRELLERGDVVRALQDAVAAGKVRVAAYSGDNEALDHAVSCGAFASVQVSLNICDQAALAGPLARATAAGLGVIAKRPLANAVWRHTSPCDPRTRPDLAEYQTRYQTAIAETVSAALAAGHVATPAELALRFAAFQPGVHSCIVGTTQLASLEANVAVLAHGPLPQPLLATLCTQFAACGTDWRGVV